MTFPGTEPTGEVAIEIAPALDARSADALLGERVDTILRRTCKIARLLTGAEQAALNLCVSGDPAKARKYFSLSKKYAAWRDFRVDPKGIGLHRMAIPPGEVLRLTEAEVYEHPLWRNFDTTALEHPPMRGWLATSVCGADGHRYGLLQLSDKNEGRDFDENDEGSIRELAALIGEVLDESTGQSRSPTPPRSPSPVGRRTFFRSLAGRNSRCAHAAKRSQRTSPVSVGRQSWKAGRGWGLGVHPAAYAGSPDGLPSAYLDGGGSCGPAAFTSDSRRRLGRCERKPTE